LINSFQILEESYRNNEYKATFKIFYDEADGGGVASIGQWWDVNVSGVDGSAAYLGLESHINHTKNVLLFGVDAASGGYSQINSKLQIGYSQSVPDFTKTEALSVNGDVVASGKITGDRVFNGSDIRLKQDVRYLDDKFIEFRRIDTPDVLRYGVSAQDIEKTNPELVTEGSDGYKTVNYIDLLVLEVVKLKSRIKKLEDNARNNK